MHASLTTSATVANRQPGLFLDDGGNTLFLQHTTLLQAAGVSVQYQFANGIAPNNDSVNTVGVVIPPLIALKGSFRIRTNTAALQAGDQWTAPQYLIYEWGEWDE